ncbi:MAG: KEOPS complex subunit Cgi121 [Sulfolobales archaeon]
MIRIKVRFLGSLALILGREESYTFNERISLRKLLLEILSSRREFSRAVNNDGSPRPGYLVFVNEVDYQIQGLDQELRDGDIVTIMPVSHGGSAGSLEDLVIMFLDLERRCRVYYYMVEAWSKEFWKELEGLGEGFYFQIFNPDKVPTERILLFSVAKVIRAFKTGTNIAKNASIELLLRLGGSRDIRKALKLLGVEDGEKAVISVISCKENYEPEISFRKLNPDQETRIRWLTNLSKEFEINTVICDNIDKVDSRIECLEKSILNKISLIL